MDIYKNLQHVPDQLMKSSSKTPKIVPQNFLGRKSPINESYTFDFCEIEGGANKQIM